MLSIPTLAQILTVIGLALLGTAVVVAGLATLLGQNRPATTGNRTRPATPRPAIATLPRQRTRTQQTDAAR
jgi:hypothetical protein